MSNTDALLKNSGFLKQRQKGFYSLRLHVTGGNLTAGHLRAVADVADRYGRGMVHMTSRQGVEIPYIAISDIENAKEVLAASHLAPGSCGPRVRTVTACQGAAICPSGCIDTQTLAKELDSRYYGRELPHKFKFGVTGCRNNCLKAEENDFGIKGAMTVSYDKTVCICCGVCVNVCREGALAQTGDGISIDKGRCVSCGRCVKSCPADAWKGESGYLVSFGGMFGNQIFKGRTPLPVIADKETLFRVADAAINYFAAYAKRGERFRFTLQRTGFGRLMKIVSEAIDGQA